MINCLSSLSHRGAPYKTKPTPHARGGFVITAHEREHRDLDIRHAQPVLRKGHRPHIDSYSAFFENDHHTPTGLTGHLRERAPDRVFVAGLALDFCVRYSAVDAHSQPLELIGCDVQAEQIIDRLRKRRRQRYHRP